MYTSIFSILPSYDSDGYEERGAEMHIHAMETKSKLTAFLQEFITSHIITVNIEDTLGRTSYGDWGIVILEDGLVIQEFSMNMMYFNDCTNGEYNDVVDISAICIAANKSLNRLNKFTRSLRDQEKRYFELMKPSYEAIRKEKNERKQLEELLKKYPDMKV